MKKNKKLDYFKVILLILFSGNPVILNAEFAKLFYIGLGFFCFILLMFKPNLVFVKDVSRYILFFLFIFIVQLFIFQWISIFGVFGFIIKIFIGAFIIRSLGDKFIDIYTNIIAFIAGYSFLIFLLVRFNIVIIPDLIPVVGAQNTQSIGFFIYNIFFKQNQGMFWEPGAFAGFIILALLLNIDNLWQKVLNHRLKFAALTLALLSTFSTTAYLLFFLIIMFLSINLIKKHMIIGVLFILITTYIGVKIYSDTDFLSEKLENQYELGMSLEGSYDPSRLGSFMFDLHYIKKHPMIGNGLHEKTRFADHPWLQNNDRAGAGNGFSNFVASMGLLSMFFYFYMLHKRIPFYRKEKFFFLLIILLLLQTEQYLNFPLFLGLPFLLTAKKHTLNNKFSN